MFILQLRANNFGTAQAAWTEVYEVIDELTNKSEEADRLMDKAQPMGASRDIKRELSKRNKGKAKEKKEEEEMDDEFIASEKTQTKMARWPKPPGATPL